MKRGYGPNEVDTRLIAALPKLWEWGVETSDIADRFSTSDDAVREYARRLKLPARKRVRTHKPEMSRLERRRQHMKKLHCLRHRNSIQQPDPIILEPSPSLFGAPLKRLDEETRTLIDEAVARSQKPRRAYHRRRDARG